MKTSLFISYAWTNDAHRDWVRLLSNQLRLLGYTVKIDAAVNYGSSLTGFMREVTEADRVLLVADENYVNRADHLPESGVGIENQWIRSVYQEKPVAWLSALFVNNPHHQLPAWLSDQSPKGFDFNANPDPNDDRGPEQMDALWRWIEGLPADKAHALSPAMLLERVARIERINAMRDPANYANPALKGRVTFRHRDHENYTVGHGEFGFKIKFTDHSDNGVFVYKDGLEAVGLITASGFDPRTVDVFLRPGRTVQPIEGQSVVLLSATGALCVITIEKVQREVNEAQYIPSEVTFRYEILTARQASVPLRRHTSTCRLEGIRAHHRIRPARA